jgi:hypothetical protein
MGWKVFVDFLVEKEPPQVHGHDLARAFYAESMSFKLFKKVWEVYVDFWAYVA